MKQLNLPFTEIPLSKVEFKKILDDVEPSSVKVFNDLDEGVGPPDGTFQDPTVQTVICNRKIHSGGSSTTILRRRQEDPEVRDFLDPRTFTTIKTEVATWDVAYRREPCKLHPEGITTSFSMDIPSKPITQQTYTREMQYDAQDRSDTK